MILKRRATGKIFRTICDFQGSFNADSLLCGNFKLFAMLRNHERSNQIKANAVFHRESESSCTKPHVCRLWNGSSLAHSCRLNQIKLECECGLGPDDYDYECLISRKHIKLLLSTIVSHNYASSFSPSRRVRREKLMKMKITDFRHVRTSSWWLIYDIKRWVINYNCCRH